MIIIKPILTEKSQLIYQKNKIYSFLVSPQANKWQIRKTFEQMFQVKVKKIGTSRQKPVLQKVRYSQKSPGKLYTKLRKKAFIELMPSQKPSETLAKIFQLE